MIKNGEWKVAKHPLPLLLHTGSFSYCGHGTNEGVLEGSLLPRTGYESRATCSRIREISSGLSIRYSRRSASRYSAIFLVGM